RENPSILRYQLDWASRLNGVGLMQRKAGRPAEAMASYERALALGEQLTRDHPESPDAASQVGATLNNIAILHLDQKQYEEARMKIDRAIRWQRKALAIKPDHMIYKQFI